LNSSRGQLRLGAAAQSSRDLLTKDLAAPRGFSGHGAVTFVEQFRKRGLPVRGFVAKWRSGG